jgi:hypothetical protein
VPSPADDFHRLSEASIAWTSWGHVVVVLNDANAARVGATRRYHEDLFIERDATALLGFSSGEEAAAIGRSTHLPSFRAYPPAYR